MNVRDDKVGKTISDQKLADLRSSSLWTGEPECRKHQDNEVEAHSIDKLCSKDFVTSRRNNTALSGEPSCLQVTSYIPDQHSHPQM